MNVIFVVLMLVILTSIGLAMYWMHSKCAATTKVEKMSNSKPKATCTSSKDRAIFFSMEGCPHCDNFNDDWKAFSNNVKAAGWVPEKHVYYSKETDGKVNDECVKQYVASEKPLVSSFPTVLFIKADGEVTLYEGSRTVDDLTAKLHSLAE